jgi:hypothetical protein
LVICFRVIGLLVNVTHLRYGFGPNTRNMR